MELPALYKIADVLAGAVQQFASFCYIGYATHNIAVKITNGEGVLLGLRHKNKDIGYRLSTRKLLK